MLQVGEDEDIAELKQQIKVKFTIYIHMLDDV